MNRQLRNFWCLLLVGVLLTGCHPTQPFYLHSDRDLSHFVTQATTIDYPDVDTIVLEEAKYSGPPLTVVRPDFEEIWELSLEDAVCLTLQNSKVLRTIGGRVLGPRNSDTTAPDLLTGRGVLARTIYDPAIQESDPDTGLEAALSAFDAQLSASMLWERRDRPRNFVSTQFFTAIDDQTTATAEVELSKRTVPGTQWSLRNRTLYEHLRVRAPSQPLSSIWTAEWELEARHPLARGAGAKVNRIPVMLARINTDISLAQFEEAVIDTVAGVEDAYWNLYCGYRELDAVMEARDSALATWKNVEAKTPELESIDSLAQARQRYYDFRSRVESALNNLFHLEGRLRFVMGLAAADKRMIRPANEPTTAHLRFDWSDILCEAHFRRVELRRQKWVIKQAELQLVSARNQLLPQFDLVGRYRYVGVGDELITADPRGLRFPAVGSTAYEELTNGRFEEYLFGFETSLPMGFRRELSAVRNVQLRLSREKVTLEDMELEVSHQLAAAIREVDAQHTLARSYFNQWVSAQQEVNAVQVAYETGIVRGGRGVTIDVLLDSQRRRAEAESLYYQSLCDYNKAIANVHARKGSLLEYNNIALSEGPWTSKAYQDALAHAQRRDASYSINYGLTRPKVVSRGPVKQFRHRGAPGSGAATDAQGERIETPEPTPADPSKWPSDGDPIEPANDDQPAGDLPQPAPSGPPPAAADQDLTAEAGGTGFWRWLTLDSEPPPPELVDPMIGPTAHGVLQGADRYFQSSRVAPASFTEPAGPAPTP